MNTITHAIRRGSQWVCLVRLALLCLATSAGIAAETNSQPFTSDLLMIGDSIKVTLRGPPDLNLREPIEQRIKEDGTVSMELIGSVPAAGKRTGDLEKDIHKLYVPRYYKHLSVIVQTSERFFFVGGEVKTPSRLVYIGEITVLKAVDAAGGFTDYADKSEVRIIRNNGQTELVDCAKALKDPKLDIPVYPGDKINVKRRWY